MIRSLREPANALTHLAGSLLAAVALVILVWSGIRSGDTLTLVALTVYGTSQLALYTASTLHHALRLSAAGMERLLKADCVLVFVFIAGTYTPVCLIALRDGWRWGMLGAVWVLALVGLVLKVAWMDAPTWLSTALYVALGWVALGALPALVQAVPHGGLAWFVVGGLVYTAGAVVFVLDSSWPWPGVFEAHALWHLCVVGGSGCCYVAIMRYIVPLA
ncbi:MAG: hemolysin III family protein [Chloroflexota bacterium]